MNRKNKEMISEFKNVMGIINSCRSEKELNEVVDTAYQFNVKYDNAHGYSILVRSILDKGTYIRNSIAFEFERVTSLNS